MANWEGFGSLDLSGVAADTGSARLKEGSYRVRCTEAEVGESSGSKSNRMVTVRLACKDGHGDITANFNVKHTSEQAQEIGLRQLKGFLEVSKHPNPDRPGDIKTLVGLECVIIVGMGKPYTDRDGKQRQNTEVKKFMPAGSPASGPAPTSTKSFDPNAPDPNARKSALDDEIPF